jgi:hypothetical protein
MKQEELVAFMTELNEVMNDISSWMVDMCDVVERHVDKETAEGFEQEGFTRLNKIYTMLGITVVTLDSETPLPDNMIQFPVQGREN